VKISSIVLAGLQQVDAADPAFIWIRLVGISTTDLSVSNLLLWRPFRSLRRGDANRLRKLYAHRSPRAPFLRSVGREI